MTPQRVSADREKHLRLAESAPDQVGDSAEVRAKESARQEVLVGACRELAPSLCGRVAPRFVRFFHRSSSEGNVGGRFF